jgi:hypothetical protein
MKFACRVGIFPMESSSIPDPVEAFTPKMDIAEEFQLLRTARTSLGGEALKPIDIDMDILVDAYPREANFLSSSIGENSSPSKIQLPPRTPSQDSKFRKSPSHLSSRKTPNRRFFKSEHEREYARNLMKELVQIYILQGVHGKEAFRKALNETRRRIHVRRGETAPSPPPVVSPVLVSPYPKISPPKKVETPYSERKGLQVKQPSPDKTARKLDLAQEEPLQSAAVTQGSPMEQSVRASSAAPRTPSRVKSMVAAIQSATPSNKPMPSETPKRTPGGTRVRAVAETLEKQISADMEILASQASPSKASAKASVRTPQKTTTTKSTTSKAVADERVSPKASMGSPTKPAVSPISPSKSSNPEPIDASPPKSARSAAKTPQTEIEVPRSSSRFKKVVSEIQSAAAESPKPSSPPPKRKNQGLVEKASPSRGKKLVEVVDEEKAASPLPEERKRVRRAAAMAATEEETSASVKKAKKKTSEPVEAREASLSTRKKAAHKLKPTSTTTKKRKKDAELETIPEDEAVSMPARPTRKAKTATR